MSPLDALLVTLLCLVISLIAYWQKVLTAMGSVASFFIVLVIGIFGDISWIILLLVFTLTSFVATKYKFALKEAMGAQEGVKGERGAKNVLANGLVPAIIAVISFFDHPWFPKSLSGLIFISAISVAAADTIASEIGILSSKTYLITTFARVKPGTEGGISFLGELSAFVAAVFTALLGYLMLFYSGTIGLDTRLLVIPVAAGFVGCHIDSLMGAALERRKLVTKHHTNFVSIALGALLAWLALVLV